MAENQQETWENASNGKVYVRTTDRRGDPGYEVVNPGKKFKIAYEDRLLNQDRAASDDLDVFKNGRLLPVRIFDGSEDIEEIKSNPNLIGEDEMQEILSVSHHKTFEKRIKDITNTVALERMLDMATEGDARLSRIEALKTRISDLGPDVTEHETFDIGRVEAPRGTPL